MDRTPRRWQAATFTCGSSWASWQSTTWPVRTQSAEIPEFDCRADAQVRRGAPGARPAYHFVALTQCDGGAAGARQRLRPLGNQADGGLQINFRGIYGGFSAGRHDRGLRLRRTTDVAPAGSQRSERYRQVMVLGRRRKVVARCAAVRAPGDPVPRRQSGGPSAGAAAIPQHARQADDGLAPAGQTVGSVIFADQFARHAEHRSLQTDKMSVPSLDPIHLSVVLLL